MACSVQELPDQLPPIFLGGQTAAHSRELLLGKGHPDAATLARYLDEAWLRASGNLAGELELHSVRPWMLRAR